VGSDAPNRWLTSDPPGDIDALRSSSSLGHRQLPKRSRFRIGAMPLLAVIVALAALAVGQMGLLDGLFSPTPDVQAALNNAGFDSVTATVDGDMVTLTGAAESQEDLNQVAAVALSLDGILQIDNRVVVVADEVVTLEGQIQAALTAAGFSDLDVVVDGDMATVSGAVADEASLGAAALAVLNVPGVAQLDNRLVIGTSAPSVDVQAAMAAALAADEFAYVSFEVQADLAVLKGAVPSEEARSQAAAAVLGVEGIDKIDNRLAIDGSLPIGPALPPEQLQAAAATALASAGIQTVSASVEGRRALLDGTVPLDTIGSGYFAFVEMAETAVLSVDGIDQVSSRLTLRGDGAILRSELQTLLEATPVEFALGSADLTVDGQVVLDQAALIIQSQPGLQVLIAGHTDAAGSNETNEALARQRAGAVRSYLLTRGVPTYRLVAVSYGELFPDEEATAEQNRRIEFEVGP
jgi:outer membrane protein OmpA-like peptidoglycan-associated protein